MLCSSRLASVGGASVAAFAVGAVGMVMGALVAYRLLHGVMGAEGNKLAACLCASYIGGSANFAAVAQVSEPRYMGSGAVLDCWWHFEVLLRR
jgi:uncharacterized membrane protein